jgi:phosphoesterase RecJ-like protein
MKDKDTEEKNIIEEIIFSIQKYNTFLITLHSNPDGDTLGSALAMSSWIKRMNKKASIYSFHRWRKIYDFLPNINEIILTNHVTAKFDVGILIECNNLQRTGGIVSKENFNFVINIDHHRYNEMYGDINWVDTNASATSELVYKLIKHSNMGLTRNEALYLYVGILTDTGGFKQKNATPAAYRIAAELINEPYNISPAEVANYIYYNKSLEEIKLLSLSLGTLTVVDVGRFKVAYQTITRDMYKTAGAEHDESEGIVDWGIYINGVNISILFREKEDGIVMVSFRSRGDIDVAKIAKKFGGGGHPNASGCSIKGNIENVKKDILDSIAQL